MPKLNINWFETAVGNFCLCIGTEACFKIHAQGPKWWVESWMPGVQSFYIKNKTEERAKAEALDKFNGRLGKLVDRNKALYDKLMGFEQYGWK